MQWFCPHRKDLQTQYREAMRKVSEHTERLIHTGMSEPTPIELRSVIPRSVLEQKARRRDDSKPPMDANKITLARLKRWYHHDLEKKDVKWARRLPELKEQWETARQIMQMYAASAENDGASPSSPPQEELCALLEQLTLDSKEEDDKKDKKVSRMTKLRDKRLMDLVLYEHAACLPGLSMASSKRLRVHLKSAFARCVQEYNDELEAFRTEWNGFLVCLGKVQALVNYRQNHLLELQQHESIRIQRQFEQRLADDERAKQRSVSAAGAAAVASNVSGITLGGRHPTTPGDGHGGIRGGWTAAADTQAHRIMCLVDGHLLRANVLSNPHETVSQFIRRVCMDALRIRLEPDQAVWAFIRGGPRMRDDLLVGDYARTEEIKFVVTRNTQAEPEKD